MPANTPPVAGTFGSKSSTGVGSASTWSVRIISPYCGFIGGDAAWSLVGVPERQACLARVPCA